MFRFHKFPCFDSRVLLFPSYRDLFMFSLIRFPKIGLGALSGVTLASITITGVFSSITEQQPQALGIGLIAK